MNTRQLLCALDSDPAMEDFNREVFALDQFLNAKLEDKGIYICNDEPSTKSGSHWFLIFKEPSKIYFIDSFARHPRFYRIEEKLRTMKKPITFSNEIIQNPFSTVCGEYCLFFAYHLCRNVPIETIYTLFTTDCIDNDEIVKNFVWKTYPGHERDFSNIFWFSQNKM